jgi:hypothetical protein
MSPSNSRRYAFQFSIRTLLALFVVCALLLAWWRDRSQLTAELEHTRATLDAVRRANELEAAARSGPFASSSATPRQLPPNKCATPEEFIKALREIKNWYEFADKTADPFVKTPVADATIPMLIELLRDPDEQVRTRAACTLGKIGAQAEKRHHADKIVPVLIPVLEDEVPNVRWHAAFALGNFGPDAKAAVPALRKQMNDNRSPIAGFAAEMLQRIDSKEAVEARLIELLQNPLRENRWRALDALGDLSTPKVKMALVDAFRREKDAEIRDRIAKMIARLESKPAAEPKTTAP